MKIQNLKEKVDALNMANHNIAKNREVWATKTKPLLVEVLGQIVREFPIGWYVQKLDWDQNLEGVNITFKPTNSGIVTKTNSSAKSYLKHGGTIVFSQSYNGEVFVIILYPYVDNFVGKSDNLILGRFNPGIIDEEFIVKKVAEFLDHMIVWEESTPQSKIGFNPEKR